MVSGDNHTAAQNDSNEPPARGRVRQLFHFLKDAVQLNQRPVRRLSDQPASLYLDDLPEHPAMHLARPLPDEETVDYLMRVDRPNLTRCPAPPDLLNEWLIPGWDDPYETPRILPSINRKTEEVTRTEVFEEDPDRVALWGGWQMDWEAWSQAERPSRQAMGIYETVYGLYTTLEREGEQVELMVGDGHLAWYAESDVEKAMVEIAHPMLLKRVELLFEPEAPRFMLKDTDREAEIYTGMLADIASVNHALVKQRQADLESVGYHPLGFHDTSAFLKALVQTLAPMDGVYLESGEAPSSASRTATMWRRPVLFMRRRTQGMVQAIDGILEDIENRTAFSPALQHIVGCEEDGWSGAGLTEGEGGSSPGPMPIETSDILLAKPSNAEQFDIVRRLTRGGALVVQGPPGTGKTHTIGNLVGHLLAQGKSILVTSHTAKALRVLREQVPEPLRPLCVSVLTTDQQGRKQLESAVNAINERLSRDASESLLRDAGSRAAERARLIEREQSLTALLRRAIEAEYRPIHAGGRDYTPADAARLVSAHREVLGWIPYPVKLGAALPLDDAEIARLYAGNALFDHQEERDAQLPLPQVAEMPTEEKYASMVSDFRALVGQDLSAGREFWAQTEGSSDDIEALLRDLRGAFTGRHADGWQAYAVVAGLTGGAQSQTWETLVVRIKSAVDCAGRLTAHVHLIPRLADDMPVAQQRDVLRAILVHLSAGGKLGLMTMLTHGEWKRLIQSATISAGKPEREEHFRALLVQAELLAAREELGALWDNLISSRKGQAFASLGEDPELACQPMIREIQRWLTWHRTVWWPLAMRVDKAGLALKPILDAAPRKPCPVSEYEVIERVALDELPGLLEAEARRRRLAEVEAEFGRVAETLARAGEERGVIARLMTAIRDKDPNSYAEALGYLRRLNDIFPHVRDRRAIILRLREAAPAWAEAVAARLPPHDRSNPPGPVGKAWLWRQLADELAERDKLDAAESQRELDRVKDTLRAVTLSLIESQAWGRQLKRVQGQQPVRQALMGWLDTMRKLASTRIVQVRQNLLQAARKLIKASAPAVPVWIMPLAAVAENFDPRTTHFDVLIIDEASQANLTALVAMYLADQVVIVGDHEQVSPEAVGMSQAPIQNLIATHLGGIPNAHLFDNRLSIYDLGKQAFGESIRLVEHFRCVPEIIEFSNHLSYEGTIRPLREANSSHLKPACVPFMVEGLGKNKVNEVETQAVLDLIRAMLKHEAYHGKTIGVISLVGNEQALRIETLLRKHINPTEMERRRILCGNSASFQGDERDVIILSMVDSPGGDDELLRLKREGAFEAIKKRYNVAASRARDQMWVVHSMDPDRHLQPDDIRLRLLKHLRDPLAAMRAIAEQGARTESEFERQVLQRLVSRGYQVKPQWHVGYYRIDLVVEGGGRRLAIECDGDRWHPLEKLADDMARQAVLERLGWTFARIRGSAFFRDPEAAMVPVYQHLEELGISPGHVIGDASEQDSGLVDEIKSLMQAGGEELESLPEYESVDEVEGDLLLPGVELDPGFEALVLSILSGHIGPADQEWLMRSINTRMGNKRLGKNIRASIQDALDEMTSRGVIDFDHGRYRKG